MAWLMLHHDREFDDAYVEVLEAMPKARLCKELLNGVRSIMF
jgi:hypothetical protein